MCKSQKKQVKCLGQTLLDIGIEVARFWFVLAALSILLRMVSSSLSEFSFRRRMRSSGPGHTFGELTILSAPEPSLKGQRYGLKWENSIGSAKRCDIVLRDASVKKSHAVLYLSRDRAYLSPIGKARVIVAGEQAGKKTEIYHDDVIEIGDVQLHVQLDLREVEA